MDDSAFSQELCFQVILLFEAPPLFVRIYEQADFPFYSHGGFGGEAAPPYFWTKLRPGWPKKNFLRPPPTLSEGLDDRRPPPPPPCLKVWIATVKRLRFNVVSLLKLRSTNCTKTSSCHKRPSLVTIIWYSQSLLLGLLLLYFYSFIYSFFSFSEILACTATL